MAVLALVWASLLTTSSASAQEAVRLTLRNGRQVEGKLVENVPGERIVMRGADRIWRFQGRETRTVRIEPLAGATGGAELTTAADRSASLDARELAQASLRRGRSFASADVEPSGRRRRGVQPHRTRLTAPVVLLTLGSAAMLAGGAVHAALGSKRDCYLEECYGDVYPLAKPMGKGFMIGGAVVALVGLIVLPIKLVARTRERTGGAARRPLAQRTSFSPMVESYGRRGMKLGLSGTIFF